MTKKQLEKYQKKSDDFASDQTEATADGAGETQAGNENEDSSGKSEEAAEEDDDKSFLESVWETIVDFFTGGSKDDDKTVEESDSSDGKTETDKATSENKTAEGENKENSTKTEVAAASSDAASTANKNDSDLSTPERSDASKNDEGGSWWSSLWDAVCAVAATIVETVTNYFSEGTVSPTETRKIIAGDDTANLTFVKSSPLNVMKNDVVDYNVGTGTYINEYSLKESLHDGVYDEAGNMKDINSSTYGITFTVNF